MILKIETVNLQNHMYFFEAPKLSTDIHLTYDLQEKRRHSKNVGLDKNPKLHPRLAGP